MIKLPDNLRADFESYISSTIEISHHISTKERDGYTNFYDYPFEMQQGVWIAYCEYYTDSIRYIEDDEKDLLKAEIIMAVDNARQYIGRQNELVAFWINETLKLISEQQ